VSLAIAKNEDAVGHARTLTILALSIWFVAAFVAGLLGRVNQPDQPPLVLASFIAVPIVAFLIAYAASPAFRAFADNLSLTMLVEAHLWRFVGLLFIVGALTGVLPMGFGIPAGVGDVIAALGAAILAAQLHHGTASRRWLWIWNAFGLVDLLVALATGMLYSNTTLGILARGGVTTRLMVTFPISLIPTFFVPLFILVHLLVFKKLAAARQS
jgi:hypothetical protein